MQQQGENVCHGGAAFSTGARTLVERQRRDIKRSVETEIRERSSMVASIIEDYTRHGRLTRDVDELFRMSELRDTLGRQSPGRRKRPQTTSRSTPGPSKGRLSAHWASSGIPGSGAATRATERTWDGGLRF